MSDYTQVMNKTCCLGLVAETVLDWNAQRGNRVIPTFFEGIFHRING